MAVTESEEKDQAVVDAVREVIAAHRFCDEAGELLANKRRELSEVFPPELAKHNVVVDGEVYEVHRFDAVTAPSLRHLGAAIQGSPAVSPPLPVQAEAIQQEQPNQPAEYVQQEQPNQPA